MTLADVAGVLVPKCKNMECFSGETSRGNNASAKTVFSTVKTLTDETGSSVAGLFENPKKTSRHIEARKVSDATKAKHFACLSSLSNPGKNPAFAARFDSNGDARRHFLERGRVYSARVREEANKRKLDARERRSILPWPVIVEKARKKLSSMNERERLVSGLYVLGSGTPEGAPKRLDYNAVRVYWSYKPAAPRPAEGEKPFRFSKPPKTPKGNYMVVESPDRVRLVLNEYKTVRSFGTYMATLPRPASEIVVDSLLSRPRNWLFDGADGKPISPGNLGLIVRETMKKVTGKPVGASNIRKSYITWMLSRNPSEPRRRESARHMLHSPEEQTMYIRNHEFLRDSQT